MLAKLVAKPFDRPGWVYEEKYDGYRILAYKEGARVTLLSRHDKDRTDTYRRVAAAIAQLSWRTLLLDGEVVAFDRRGVSRFQLLQVGKTLPVYAVFDCLYLNGRDLRRQPLYARRQQMESAMSGADPQVLMASQRLADNGIRAYELAKKKGYEGIVAKDASSAYVQARSGSWLKVKVHQEEEFVIAGYTAPAGSRQHFGALLLGAHQNGKLRFIGKVGTGFSQQTLASLYKKFQPLRRNAPPFYNPPRATGVTWLQPKLVGQFAFQEWTSDGKLRQPVFLGLRDDKRANEVVMPGEESV
jgi:bifunctional non-homologous end joining protein LigD